MSLKDTIYLPAGYALTLVSDAKSLGTYLRLGNPGGTQYTPDALAISTTAVVGPFNEDRTYEINSTYGQITNAIAYTGVLTAADDTANALLAPKASPTFTGTVSAPNIILTKVNGTEAANAVTASGNAGVITTSALSAAAGADYVITWTNTQIAATSVVMLTQLGGTNTKEVVFKVVPGSGSAALTISNVDLLAALDGTIKLGYLVV